MKSTAAIYDLLKSDYDERMFHRIPVAKSVVRHEWIAARCKGEDVLDIGGSGPLARIIKREAKTHRTVDKQDADFCTDLDCNQIPVTDGVSLIVCGEVIEHLSNPGFFLDGLRRGYNVPVVFTIPNAFTEIGTRHVLRGVENVNSDHVAYYSYYTFCNLLKRHGYGVVSTFLWYNGSPGVAEGMIFEAR